MSITRSLLKAFFAYACGDTSMRRSSSSLAEVETEDRVSWVTEDDIVCSGWPVCGFEVLATVGVLEEPAGFLAFTAGKSFDGSIVDVSAIVCAS